MNTCAVAFAILALIGILASISLGKRIANKTLGLIVRVLGVLGSFLLLVLLPPDDSTVSEASQYLGYLGTLTLLVWFLFFRKKAEK